MLVYFVVGKHPETDDDFVYRGSGSNAVAKDMLRSLRSDLAVGYPSMSDKAFDDLAFRRKSLRIVEVELNAEIIVRKPVATITGVV